MVKPVQLKPCWLLLSPQSRLLDGGLARVRDVDALGTGAVLRVVITFAPASFGIARSEGLWIRWPDCGASEQAAPCRPWRFAQPGFEGDARKLPVPYPAEGYFFGVGGDGGVGLAPGATPRGGGVSRDAGVDEDP